ncbi:MAG: hydantoinase B/oxoprolinase family protein [Actinobacteria bacterium]|nr:hydantoinase B/oxoprolinase family protein [Actinomycetota bacterium]
MNNPTFTLEVFINLIKSAADEMGTVLHRTAFSPNIKERKDHSCAVFDARGKLVAQAEHIPVHLGAMPETVKTVLDNFRLEEGDLVILNDPFTGGTHLPDISMVSPVYIDGKITAVLASRAHHSDIGGYAPGSLALVSDIFQEGLIIPPVRLISKGEYQYGTEEMITANTRSPHERKGDLEAQVSAHTIGEKRIRNIAARLGREVMLSRFEEIMDYSEKLTRLAISNMPDGKYCFTDCLDDDGFSKNEILINVEVKIEGNEITVDFTGSSPQVEGPFNCPRAVTYSAVYYVMKCVTGAEIPANAGAFRPVTIKIPASSLLSATRPHAVGGGNVETSQRIVDTIIGALARALPHLIPAASQGTMNNLSIGSLAGTSGKPWSYYETIGGGAGAGPNREGASAVHTHMTNTLNTPVEALEYAYPLRVNRYEIRRNSGGRGKHRGGGGGIREIQALEECHATILSDRRSRGPWGLEGGEDGKPGKNKLVRNGKAEKLPSKCNLKLKKGDKLKIETPGGGGWGKLQG